MKPRQLCAVLMHCQRPSKNTLRQRHVVRHEPLCFCLCLYGGYASRQHYVTAHNKHRTAGDNYGVPKERQAAAIATTVSARKGTQTARPDPVHRKERAHTAQRSLTAPAWRWRKCRQSTNGVEVLHATRRGVGKAEARQAGVAGHGRGNGA